MAERKVRIYTIAVIGMLLCMAGFMLVHASKQSFWYDELDWTIGLINQKPMLHALLEYGAHPPLYFIILKPLYELLPYGEMYLLIPSIAFVILGIMITGKAGKIIGGIDLGFVAVCIAVSSGTLIAYSWELRPYTIAFCFSSLALLMYIKRLKQETNSNILNYGISLGLLLYSHWFGTILALSYALIDLYLYLRKKVSPKCIFPYILAGLLFLPWVFMWLPLHANSFSADLWSPTPGDIVPISTVFFLLTSSLVYLFLFNIGFIIILFKNVRENKALDAFKIWFFISIGIIWTILLGYIYCKYIHPSGTIYANRDFLVIMPHVFLITAYGFLKAFSVIQHNFFTTAIKRRFLYGIVIAFFCINIFRAYQKTYSNPMVDQPYREVAELLSQEEQIASANTLVISSYGTAWIEYYFSKRGFAIPANVALCTSWASFLFIYNGQYIQPIILSKEDILNFDIIYAFQVSENFPEDFIYTISQYYNIYQPNQAYQLYYCLRR